MLVSLAPLLAVTALLAQNADFRLIEAVTSGDRESARSLLKQGVNVNQKQLDGATALAWAVHYDNLELVKLLIAAGADVNAANDYGVTPLALACDNGSVVMVETLLNARADPDRPRLSGETPMMTCVYRGSVGGARALLARGANVNAAETRHGQTALMWAAEHKHPDLVRVLIEHGADVHARTKPGAPWRFATYPNSEGTQEVRSGGYTPLHFAARRGDLESIKVLLAAGAKLNEPAADGLTPFLLACANSYESVALFLLEKGADPHTADGNGVAPLHYAIGKGLSLASGGGRGGGPEPPNMRKLVEGLLAKRVNPNVRLGKPPLRMRLVGAPLIEPEGATPFLLAAASRDLPLLQRLLAAGADPKATTTDNTTALMMAAGLAGASGSGARGRANKEQEKEALEIVQVLVELGNDVNAVNTNIERTINGKTAVHAATYQGMDSVIQFLAEKGANLAAADRCGETPMNIALGDPGHLRYQTERIRGGYKSTAELLRKLGGDVPPGVPEVRCENLAGTRARFTSPTKLITYKPDGTKPEATMKGDTAKPADANPPR